MGSLIIGAIEFIFGLACAFQQMATTHDSVVSAFQGGTLITSHMTAQDVLFIFNQNADKYNRIGWFCALATQLMFLSSVLPSPLKGHTIRAILLWLFGVCEILTDIWYSIATTVNLSGVIAFVFSLNWSGILGCLFYVIAMTAGSIFLFLDGLHRVEFGIGQLRGAPQPKTVHAK